MTAIKKIVLALGVATWVAWIVMGVLILRKKQPVSYITYGCAWGVAIWFMGLYWIGKFIN